MNVKAVCDYLEELAPLAYAESFDNVGLLVGDSTMEVSGVLITLDTLENVIDEAIAKKCNLIVSFHPIIFGGLKKITGRDYVERVVLKAIKNDIAIYSMHTALDNVLQGVSAQICKQLSLTHFKTLIPQKNTLKKLTTYVPRAKKEVLLQALYQAGAGNVGNYSECSFSTIGASTFKGAATSNPVVGQAGITENTIEDQLHVTFNAKDESKVIKALFDCHPYEEVAYEVTTLDNTNQNIGMGMIGELETSMQEEAFMHFLKAKMQVKCIRHSKLLNKKIKKVAVLGGSGSFGLKNAIGQGADVYISADFKYHEFYQAENQIIIMDIGHYESEQFTKKLLYDYLKKKFSTFAVILSEEITNPINYF